MKKQSLKIYALLLSLLMLLTALVVLPASAIEEPAPNPDDPNPQAPYDTIYYITDTADLSVYWPYIQQSVSYSYLFQEQNQNDFWDLITIGANLFASQNPTLQSMDDISDAIIVFEITKGIRLRTPSDLTYLNTLFASWETNGCMILFLSDTDEICYGNYGYNAFLDHVKVHANLDMMRYFMANFMNRVIIDSGGATINNSTFIISKNYCPSNVTDDYHFNTFAYYYLLPYLRYIYEEEIRIAQTPESTVYADNNIHILLDLGDGSYYDYIDNITIHTEAIGFEIAYFMDQRIYAVGYTKPDPAYEASWMQSIFALEENIESLCESFSLNLYDPINLISSIAVGCTTYVGGQGLATFPSTAMDIIDLMVIKDENGLVVYDNFPEGRCEITYKPYSYSSNPWMSEYDSLFGFYGYPNGDMIILPFFDLAGMSASDYNYYFA